MFCTWYLHVNKIRFITLIDVFWSCRLRSNVSLHCSTTNMNAVLYLLKLNCTFLLLKIKHFSFVFFLFINFSYFQFKSTTSYKKLMIKNLACSGNETDISLCSSDDWDSGNGGCNTYHTYVDCRRCKLFFVV